MHALGYERSYQRFTHELRARDLRPACPDCWGARSRATVEIEHEPGEEIQWDWVELPGAPWGGTAHLLQGVLPYSGKFRGVLVESEDQAHLVDAIDRSLRRLGGSARGWRIDRMSTAVEPKTGKVLASFAAVAKHYGVSLAVCPAYHPRRKGAVEKAQHFTTQRWWRTSSSPSLEQAQRHYDRFCEEIADGRCRHHQTVAEAALDEHLLALPEQPFPASIEVWRVVDDSSLISYRGNRYSILPGLEGGEVMVRWRLGASQIEIVSALGQALAAHRREADGAGVIARLPEHRAAQQAAVLAVSGSVRSCRHKVRRPLSAEALEVAARVRSAAAAAPDLQEYAALAGAMR